MAAKRVCFIVDGGFVRKRFKFLSPSTLFSGPFLLDYCRKHLRQDEELLRVFFYDAEPFSQKLLHPLTDMTIDYSQTTVAKEAHALFESLRKTPHVVLRLGFLTWNRRWKASWDNTVKPILMGTRDLAANPLVPSEKRGIAPELTQKAVDVYLGLDIASISIRKTADVLVILAGDSDIAPVVRCAREEGLQVRLDSLWQNIRPELEQELDEVVTFTCKPALVHPGARPGRLTRDEDGEYPCGTTGPAKP
ncbi:NYN domain-containing protein [Desulfovibrio aminophilus]|nr:NYN domain-containing protein [Desulfovibrio aminophilus]MCM0754207.1 NYN domain-containing protein [Desulfovibrio aminophilus]